MREETPSGDFMPLAETSTTIELPLERPLYRPPPKTSITALAIDSGNAEVDTAVLYSQTAVDRGELKRHIQQALQNRTQISLGEVVKLHPLHHGLLELTAYLQLAGEWPGTTVDEETEEHIHWSSGKDTMRRAALPRIIFIKELGRIRN